jgi:hypothetical protein
LQVSQASAGKTVVGVNVIDVNKMNEAQQDALVAQLRNDGVTTVRTGFGPEFRHFILQAYKNGIGTVAIISPFAGYEVSGRPVDTSVGLTWTQPALSDADPAAFQRWFAAELEAMEAEGARLTAFELGNELNSAHYNGDFKTSETSHRLLGLADLKNPKDGEGRRIAAGYMNYLKVMAALKEARDRSKLNRGARILSAGLVTAGAPAKHPDWKIDGVNSSDTIAFWKQNGMDALVDGYGVHAYLAPNPQRTVAMVAASLKSDALAMCSAEKPCWLTEWGFENKSATCPVDESVRVKLVSTMRGALKEFTSQGKLDAALYYSWSGRSGEVGSTIFRCGGLTSAGKLALSPM